MYNIKDKIAKKFRGINKFWQIGGDKMLNANGVTVRFGKRVLFEDVNIRFGKGNCYGIIRRKWCW